MKNNFIVKIKIIIGGSPVKLTRYVAAESPLDACQRAEEFYEDQGYAAFCTCKGDIDNLLPWDIS